MLEWTYYVRPEDPSKDYGPWKDPEDTQSPRPSEMHWSEQNQTHGETSGSPLRARVNVKDPVINTALLKGMGIRGPFTNNTPRTQYSTCGANS